MNVSWNNNGHTHTLNSGNSIISGGMWLISAHLFEPGEVSVEVNRGLHAPSPSRPTSALSLKCVWDSNVHSCVEGGGGCFLIFSCDNSPLLCPPPLSPSLHFMFRHSPPPKNPVWWDDDFFYALIYFSFLAHCLCFCLPVEPRKEEGAVVGGFSHFSSFSVICLG